MVIIDVGRSMGKVVGGGGITGLDHAKKALRLMIQQKLLFTKRDELGVVLVGTKKTENPLNDEVGEGYEHVTVLNTLKVPDLEMLESVDNIDCQDSEGDVIDGLLVAMAVIKERVKKLKFSKRIFLVTD